MTLTAEIATRPSHTREYVVPPGGDYLPVGEALEEYYLHAFDSLDLPETGREAKWDESLDIELLPFAQLDTSSAGLREAFLRQAPRRAQQASWWTQDCSRAEKSFGIAGLHELPLLGKHHIDITVKGNTVGAGYDVLELNQAADPKVIETTIAALKLCDQLSGGLLSAQPSTTRVLLVGGVDTSLEADNRPELIGLATDSATIISIEALKRARGVTEDNFYQLLSTVVVHEVLGHVLEYCVESTYGRNFADHFSYTDFGPGKLENEIAHTVTSRDPDIPSQPVREHGRRNSSEDLATSVDATVAAAMGWDKALHGIDRASSELDAHRRDLVLAFLGKAAKKALVYKHTPGTVSSDLVYREADESGPARHEPLRHMEVTRFRGNDAVQSELERVVREIAPKGEFVYGEGQNWF